MQQTRSSDPTTINHITLGNKQVAFSGVARPVVNPVNAHTVAKTQVQSDFHPISQGAVESVLVVGGLVFAGMLALLVNTMRQYDRNHSSPKDHNAYTPRSVFKGIERHIHLK